MTRDAWAIGRHLTAPGLALVPVGVGAAYARSGEAQSCYLVRAGGTAVVLDLGSGALNRLQDQVVLEELAALVVSHLHPDHFIDLLSLRIYLAFGTVRAPRLRVLGPPGLRDLLTAVGGGEGWDEAFAFEDLTGKGGRRDLGGGLTLAYRQVPHLPPTFALRVEGAAAAVCYGADCAPNDALPELAAGADVLVCECSFGAGEVPAGVPHLNARGAGAIAARAGAGRLLLTHCYPEHDREATLAAAREAFAGPAAWATQGEEVVA